MSIYLLIKYPQTEDEFITELLKHPYIGVLDHMYQENNSITFTPVHVHTCYYRYSVSYEEQTSQKGVSHYKISTENFCKLYRYSLRQEDLVLKDWLVKCGDQSEELINDLNEEQGDYLVEKFIESEAWRLKGSINIDEELKKIEISDDCIYLDLKGHPVAPKVCIKFSNERLERLIGLYDGLEEIQDNLKKFMKIPQIMNDNLDNFTHTPARNKNEEKKIDNVEAYKKLNKEQPVSQRLVYERTPEFSRSSNNFFNGISNSTSTSVRSNSNLTTWGIDSSKNGDSSSLSSLTEINFRNYVSRPGNSNH